MISNMELLLIILIKRFLEPVISIIGTMPHLGFLRYLVASLCLQRSPVTYGRIQIFAMVNSKDFRVRFSLSCKNYIV